MDSLQLYCDPSYCASIAADGAAHTQPHLHFHAPLLCIVPHIEQEGPQQVEAVQPALVVVSLAQAVV
jgi:hypothetical protein